MKLIAITCKKGEKIFAFYFFTTVFICNTIYMESAFAKLDVKHQGPWQPAETVQKILDNISLLL